MSAETLRARIRDLMPQAKADLASMVSFKSVHDAKQFPPAECQAMVDFVVKSFRGARATRRPGVRNT